MSLCVQTAYIFADSVRSRSIWTVLGWFWIISCSFPLLTLLSPPFWYKLILVSSVQRIWFQNFGGFFRCFLTKFNVSFLFLNVLCGLHLVVNWLYLQSWRRLLTLTDDPPTFSNVLSLSPCCEGRTKEEILPSSPSLVLQAIWCSAHELVRSLQTVDSASHTVFVFSDRFI